MAQKTVVTFIDDLDGESEADGTVPFAIDGTEYEIDLTKENAEDFREIFAPYIAAARRTGGRRASSSGRARPSNASSTSSASGPVARSPQVDP